MAINLEDIQPEQAVYYSTWERVEVQYGAVENKNKHAGGYLPIVDINGRKEGDTWSRAGLSREEAVELARRYAIQELDKCRGDYVFSLVLSIDFHSSPG